MNHSWFINCNIYVGLHACSYLFGKSGPTICRLLNSMQYESGRFLMELAGRFEWWDNSARVEWLERVDVLFPFFFRFERHDEAPVVSATNAVQLDASVWFRFRGGSAIRISGRATPPFVSRGESTDPEAPGGGAPAPPEGTEPSRHGGLRGIT